MADQSISVLTPLLYVGVLGCALVLFARRHRSRKLKELADTPQFYSSNYYKDIFEQLRAKEKVPPKLLKAALLAWAAEDITRLYKFRESEAALNNLLQNGLIGEGIYERFMGSKVLNEREIQEIAGTSLELSPTWTTAMQSASEIAQRNAIRRRMDQISIFEEEYSDITGKSLS